MPRSRRYSAYKYEWTRLVHAISTTSDHLEVPFASPNEAESQRQEWYAFLRALQSEAERKANSDSFREEMAALHAQASQIACQRRGHTLSFLKKSATPTGQRLSQALDSFEAPEPPARTAFESLDSQPSDPQSSEPEDPFSSVLSEFERAPESPPSQSSLDEQRREKDRQLASNLHRVFESWEEDEDD